MKNNMTELNYQNNDDYICNLCGGDIYRDIYDNDGIHYCSVECADSA